MKKKKLNFKKILVTASAFAFVAGVSTNALGGAISHLWTTTDAAAGEPVVVTKDGGTGIGRALNNGAATTDPDVFVDNSSFYLRDNIKSLKFGGGGSVAGGSPAATQIKTLDFNGKTTGAITVEKTLTVASIIDSKNAAAGARGFTVRDDESLILDGTGGLNAVGDTQVKGNFSALGDIRLGDAGGSAAMLEVNLATTLAGKIDSQVGKEAGILNVNGDDVVFDGAIGFQDALAAIKINSAHTATFNAVVRATELKFGNAGTAVLNGDFQGNIDFASKAATVKLLDGAIITGGVICSGEGATGTLQFDGAGTVTGSIGVNGAVNLVKANGGGIVDIRRIANVIEFDVANAGADVRFSGGFGGTLYFSAAGRAKFSAGFDGSADFKGHEGVLEIANTDAFAGIVNTGVNPAGIIRITGTEVMEIVGRIGSDTPVSLIEVATTTDSAVRIVAAVNATTLKINGANNNSVVELKHDFNGNVEFAKGGTVNITADGAHVRHTIGTVTNTSGDDNKGNIFIAAHSATIDGDIGAEGAALNDVKIDGDVALNLTGVLANSTKKHYAKTFTFANNSAATIAVGNGDLYASGNDQGIGFVSEDGGGRIEFTSSGKIVGIIGDNKQGLGAVEAGGGVEIATAGDHKVAVFSTKNANSRFTFADGVNIDGEIDNTCDLEENETALIFEGVSTVTGKVGASNTFNAILIAAGTGKEVDFQSDVKVTTLQINHKDIAKIKGKIEGGVELNHDANTVTDNDGSNDSRLVFYSPDDHEVRKITTGTEASMGMVQIDGTVAAKSVTFNGTIGNVDNNSAVALIETNAGFTGNMIFSENAHVTKLKLADDNKVILGGAGGKKYKFGAIEIASTEKGKLMIGSAGGGDRVTLVGPGEGKDRVQFGTESSKLYDLSFSGNNTTLDIEKNIDIAVRTIGAENGGDPRGVITFRGNNTLRGGTMESQRINTIDVYGNADEAVRFTDAIFAGDAVTIHNSAVLEIEKVLTATGIKASVEGNGTLRFMNPDAIVMQSSIGSTVLGTIEFGGKDVEFKGAVTKSNNFKFNSSDAVNVKFADTTDIQAGKFTSENKDITHTVVMPNTIAIAVPPINTIAFAGELADNGNPIDFQSNNEAHEITINTTKAKGAGFTTSTNGKAKLTLGVDQTEIRSVGADGAQFERIDFANNGTISSDSYALKIGVGAGKSASMGGVIKTAELKLVDTASSLTLLDGATLESIVQNGGDKFSAVTFKGSATVNANIGKTGQSLGTVNFSDDEAYTVSLNSDIYSDIVNAKKGKLKLTNKDVNITSSNMNFTESNIDLGVYSLNSWKSNNNFSDLNTIVTDVSPKSNDTTIYAGTIVISNGRLQFSSNAAFNITINDKGTGRPVGDNTREFALIKNNTNDAVVNNYKLDLSKVEFVTSDKSSIMTKWGKALADDGSLVLIQHDNSENGMIGIAEKIGLNAAENRENFKALAAAADNTGADKIINLLDMVQNSPDDAEKVIVGLQNRTVVNNAVDQLASDFSSHSMARINMIQPQAAAAAAAGDENSKYGAWFTPFYNNTVQKLRKGYAGYGGKSYGGTIGADVKTSEDMLFGLSALVAKTKMKHKDRKSGDTTDIDSYMLSLYTAKNINDFWSLQSAFTFGSNNIANDTKKPSGVGTTESVKGKYDTMSFSGEALFSYNQDIGGVMFSPLGGLRYSRVNGSGYTESGSTTGQNLTVNAKDINKLDVTGGLRISTQSLDMAGVPVTPEMHASVNHDILGRAQKQSVRVDGSGKLASSAYDPARTSYGFGISVNAEYDMIECGMGYDAQISDKRIGHQGNLRLKVNI